MKKKSTTIVLIVIIIGLIGSGIAFYMMKNAAPIEDQTTSSSTPNTSQITEENISEVQSPTDIIPVPTEDETQGKDYIGKTGEISIDETFYKLDEYYGKDYESNCIDKNTDKPVFKITDKSNGETYAYVQVDLNTAIATETIESTKETKEFSLFG